MRRCGQTGNMERWGWGLLTAFLAAAAGAHGGWAWAAENAKNAPDRPTAGAAVRLPDAQPAGKNSAAADNTPRPAPESWLRWLGRALGPFYGTLFLAVSFVLAALVVMNLLALRREAIAPTPLVQGFDACLIEKKPLEAQELARRDDSLLGRVLAVGMSRLAGGAEETLRSMEEAGQAEGLRLEQRLSYVALIARLCPLLGLLGTVDRLIQTFGRNQMPRPAELGMALAALLVALWLALPAAVFHAALRPRLLRLLAEAGSVSENLIRRALNGERPAKKV